MWNDEEMKYQQLTFRMLRDMMMAFRHLVPKLEASNDWRTLMDEATKYIDELTLARASNTNIVEQKEIDE